MGGHALQVMPWKLLWRDTTSNWNHHFGGLIDSQAINCFFYSSCWPFLFRGLILLSYIFWLSSSAKLANITPITSIYARHLIHSSRLNGAHGHQHPSTPILEVEQNADALQRLAQPHVIRQHGTQAVLAQTGHPAEARQLVGPQLMCHGLVSFFAFF